MNYTVSVVSRSWRYISILQKEFVYGGYLTSLGSPILVVFSALVLNVNVNPPILAITYLIPLIVYSINYYCERNEDAETNPERAELINKKVKIFPLIIGFYILALSILVFLYGNLAVAGFTAALVLGGIAYTVFSKSLTKRVPGFKNVFASLIWAIDGVFFLAAYYSLGISSTSILIFLFIFMKGLLNLIFFDIKDMKTDEQVGLKTLPIIMGKKRTLESLHVLNLLAYVPILAGVIAGALPIFTLSLLALCPYTFMYLRKSEGLESGEIRIISYTLAETETIWGLILLFIGKAVIGVI